MEKIIQRLRLENQEREREVKEREGDIGNIQNHLQWKEQEMRKKDEEIDRLWS